MDWRIRNEIQQIFRNITGYMFGDHNENGSNRGFACNVCLDIFTYIARLLNLSYILPLLATAKHSEIIYIFLKIVE